MKPDNRLIGSLVFFLLLGFSPYLKAQQPAWTDYYKRAQMYPESEWISGFVSGFNSDNEDPGKLVDIYEAMARNKVVQSIEVEIETQNDLSISNINGKSDEAFLSKSVSFSNAKINGLRTEHYYDKKNNQVYAFSFVNKKELAFYYKNLLLANQKQLEQKLKEGRAFLKLGNKENALRSFYEGMPLLAEINQAHRLLLALNQKMLAEIGLDEINQLRLDFNAEISNLQKGSELNMSEAAYFVAYGLFVQIGELASPIFQEPSTYLNTGFSSQFSELWTSALKDALIKAGGYKLQDSEPKGASETSVVGNYWIQDEELQISNQLIKNGNVVAVSMGSIPLKWLQAQNISFLPKELERINKLNQFKLDPLQSDINVKAGMASEKPVAVKVSINSDAGSEPASNIPLLFVNKQSGKVLCKATSDEMGVASAFLPPMGFDIPKVQIEAMVDIATYVPLDTTSSYAALVQKNLNMIPARMQVHVQKQVYCIQSEELLLGSPLEIKTIEPMLKQALVDQGYQFTDYPEEADFLILIEASSTTGTSYQGIFFTFVDANLSVINNSNDKEVFKTHVEQVKGGGADYVKAGKKAYAQAAEKLKEAWAAYQ